MTRAALAHMGDGGGRQEAVDCKPFPSLHGDERRKHQMGRMGEEGAQRGPCSLLPAS